MQTLIQQVMDETQECISHDLHGDIDAADLWAAILAVEF